MKMRCSWWRSEGVAGGRQQRREGLRCSCSRPAAQALCLPRVLPRAVLRGFDGPGVPNRKEQKLELRGGRVIREPCLVLGLLKLVTLSAFMTRQNLRAFKKNQTASGISGRECFPSNTPEETDDKGKD